MLKKLLYKFVVKKAHEEPNKTMIYLVQAVTLFLISFSLAILAGFLSWINAKESMTATQVTVTFALILASIQVFIRFLDVVFEAMMYEYDKKG